MSSTTTYISVVNTIVNSLLSIFGLNQKQFYDFYDKSAELRSQVDKMADDYLRKYEDKISISTPSTSPTLSRFISEQINRDKDRILALQRKIQTIDDRAQRDKDNPTINYDKMDNYMTDYNKAKEEFDNFKTSAGKITTAIVRGAENRFTNANRASKWKENNAI